MSPFDFRFEEINLLPSFIGKDGKPHRYGDHLLTGSAEIYTDSDGDWWIASISIETAEPIDRWDRSKGWVWRDIPRDEPEFVLFRDAIARECEEDINEEVRLHVMDEAA